MHRTRRSYLLILAASCWLASTMASRADSRPNFVAIIADDHGVYHSTVYGSEEQNTPHMQSLADDGMTFDRAYVASPACAPSRHALISGQMPERNGVVGNHEHKLYKLDASESLIHQLIEAGYEVVFRGKVSHGKKEGVVPDGVVQLPGDNRLLDPANVESYLSEREDKTRPVALFIGPTDTHTIWPSGTEEVAFDPGDAVLPPKTFDTAEARDLMARYNQAVENVDACVGKVRELVRRQLDEDNTLILYTSDHGQNWPFGKWSLYETGVRSPLIAVWPGKIAPGVRTDAMVSWIDILPTFLDLAGVPGAEDIDGKSFQPVLLGETEVHREEIYTVHKGDRTVNVYPIRAVRTEKWKYILNLFPEFYNTTHIDVPVFREGHRFPGRENSHYFPEWQSWIESAESNQEAAQFLHLYHSRPKEELYLLEEDPFEENNLAFDPRYAEVLASMHAKVRARMKALGDDESLSGEPRLLKDHPLPPALKLYFPNGGERFQRGQTVEVRWSEGWKGTDVVKLEYHDGDGWKTIEDAVPHDGSYSWEVPSAESAAVRLRITSSNGRITDESDRPFAIGAVR
ncbi:MAG: sulfatase [Verrucomicrobiota bacterium]